jgi:hypothetical protein
MENFVLSVGDTPNKELPFARDVLAMLRSRFIHLNWVIVGNRERVLKQLGPGDGGIGLPSWITVLESPTDGLLKSCYRKALCLVFPSLVRPGVREDWCAALTRLLYNPELRSQAVEAGKAKAAAQTWDQAAANVLELYGIKPDPQEKTPA